MDMDEAIVAGYKTARGGEKRNDGSLELRRVTCSEFSTLQLGCKMRTNLFRPDIVPCEIIRQIRRVFLLQ